MENFIEFYLLYVGIFSAIAFLSITILSLAEKLGYILFVKKTYKHKYAQHRIALRSLTLVSLVIITAHIIFFVWAIGKICFKGRFTEFLDRIENKFNLQRYNMDTYAEIIEQSRKLGFKSKMYKYYPRLDKRGKNIVFNLWLIELKHFLESKFKITIIIKEKIEHYSGGHITYRGYIYNEPREIVEEQDQKFEGSKSENILDIHLAIIGYIRETYNKK